MFKCLWEKVDEHLVGVMCKCVWEKAHPWDKDGHLRQIEAPRGKRGTTRRSKHLAGIVIVVIIIFHTHLSLKSSPEKKQGNCFE